MFRVFGLLWCTFETSSLSQITTTSSLSLSTTTFQKQLSLNNTPWTTHSQQLTFNSFPSTTHNHSKSPLPQQLALIIHSPSTNLYLNNSLKTFVGSKQFDIIWFNLTQKRHATNVTLFSSQQRRSWLSFCCFGTGIEYLIAKSNHYCMVLSSGSPKMILAFTGVHAAGQIPLLESKLGHHLPSSWSDIPRLVGESFQLSFGPLHQFVEGLCIGSHLPFGKELVNKIVSITWKNQ